MAATDSSNSVNKEDSYDSNKTWRGQMLQRIVLGANLDNVFINVYSKYDLNDAFENNVVAMLWWEYSHMREIAVLTYKEYHKCV